LGGNFLSAMPDTLYLQEGLTRLDLNVRIGTKLNRSDLVVGKQAMILPCLGRSEIDRRPSIPSRSTDVPPVISSPSPATPGDGRGDGSSLKSKLSTLNSSPEQFITTENSM